MVVVVVIISLEKWDIYSNSQIKDVVLITGIQ